MVGYVNESQKSPAAPSPQTKPHTTPDPLPAPHPAIKEEPLLPNRNLPWTTRTAPGYPAPSQLLNR